MKRNRTARARHNVSDPTTTIKTASKVAFIRQCISSSWQKDTFPALFESYMINQRSSIVKYKTWAPFGCYDRPRLGQYSNSIANARHLSKNLQNQYAIQFGKVTHSRTWTRIRSQRTPPRVPRLPIFNNSCWQTKVQKRTRMAGFATLHHDTEGLEDQEPDSECVNVVCLFGCDELWEIMFRISMSSTRSEV